MRSLVVCQGCKRHVKASETHCPFCSASVAPVATQGAVRARGLPGGRAALFLAGTALVPGCVEEPEPDGLDNHSDGGDAGSVAHDAGRDATDNTAVPVYGIAIDSGFLPVPPYGIAIPRDAGSQDSGSADAGCPRVGNLPVPVYGVPVDSGTQLDVCTDAGPDAGKDSGSHPLPPYGIAIDGGPLVTPVYGVPFDPGE